MTEIGASLQTEVEIARSRAAIVIAVTRCDALLQVAHDVVIALEGRGKNFSQTEQTASGCQAMSAICFGCSLIEAAVGAVEEHRVGVELRRNDANARRLARDFDDVLAPAPPTERSELPRGDRIGALRAKDGEPITERVVRVDFVGLPALARPFEPGAHASR